MAEEVIKPKIRRWEDTKMSGNKAIRHFGDLEVYRRAFDVAMRIYEISQTFPMEKRYSLVDQIRRSSRSACSNLAEARRIKTQISFVSADLFLTSQLLIFPTSRLLYLPGVDKKPDKGKIVRALQEIIPAFTPDL